MKFFRKLQLAIGLGALALLFAAPLVALAQTSSVEVWTESECKTVGGSWEKISDTKYDCFTAPTASPITVAIGNLSGKATLVQYVSSFYSYLTAAAAVLAVIFIMIGGFQILFSAGGEQVGEGRRKISSAILGLVLVFCSYILLQTVNPALVNLQAPRIRLTRSSYLSVLKPPNMIGEPCFTIKDKDACAQSCPAAGLSAECECVVLPETAYTYFAKGTVYAATGAIGLGTGVLTAAAQSLGRGALRALPAILKGAVKNWQATIGAVAAYKLTAGPDAGEEGICLPFAVHSLAIGEVCDVTRPKGCVLLANGQEAKCVQINSDPPYGMCVSGAENTACTVKGNECQKGLSCCEVNYGLGTCQKSCENRPNGDPCTRDSDCESGQCTVDNTTKKGICTATAYGAACGSNADCASGYYCPADVSFMNIGPSVRSVDTLYKQFASCLPQANLGAPCCDNSNCASGTTCNRQATEMCYAYIANNQLKIDNAGTCQ